jgi:integrase
VENAKHHQQWVMTLRVYAAPIRDLPVDQVDTAAIMSVLEPIWNVKSETASRLRGRIEAVLASAQVDGWIPEGRSNPARWKNWLDHKLAAPKKLGKIDRNTGEKVKRGKHAAMPHAKVQAFMARLAEIDNRASRALQIAILTACRTSEVLGMTWDEVDFDTATWSIPEERMKMDLPHRVPLSAPALAILRDLYETRGQNPHVFPVRPMRPLSNMSMAMLLRRLGAGDVTVHGFRSSFRDWATEIDKTEYATAERCLAHVTGNSTALAYDRSDRLELRRPVMAKWAEYVVGADNVIDIKREVA